MYRIPNVPSTSAKIHEITDFIEWSAFKYGSYSLREACSDIGRLEDNFNVEGVTDDYDIIDNLLEDVSAEMDFRSAACNGGYPFKLNRNGLSISKEDMSNNQKYVIYIFLLYCTRLNMNTNNIHAGHDGTLLMEFLCTYVIKNYFGSDRAQSMTFGTSSSKSFEAKVNELCEAIGEGGGFKPYYNVSSRQKDGDIDVVGWIPFADGRKNKLIVFAQCKTGTTWRQNYRQVNAQAFLKSFTINGSTSLNPVPGYFVAEATDREYWNILSTSLGLFFDRCRIVDFATVVEDTILANISDWVHEASM